MANIRIKDLPADGAPKQTDLIPIDLGSTRHATVKAVVESGRPTASKAEAEAGVEPQKAMTPLTTKQAIDAQVGASYVPKTVKVNAGSGMTGGGELSGDVTVGLTATNVDRLAKVDGIEAGAQVNTVTSVAGKTGAVTLVAADVSSAPDTLVPDINANTTARHTHSNKAILDATTASFLAAEKAKLAGVEDGAQVNTVTSVAGKTGDVTLAKGDVGLGNVDNTSDASKPVSTATQTALNAKANSSVTVSAGSGLTGGGNLTANRSIALNAASIASLVKADTAIQAPGGTAGQVLSKSSAAEGDVSWADVEGATAVSYGPQTLTEAQKTQARDNIDAFKTPSGTAGQFLRGDGTLQSVIGTVTAAAGGSIVQRGNNANGEFVRWADGTQICWHTIMAGVTTGTVGALFMTSAVTWTFPAAFSNRPNVGGSCYKISGGGVTMFGGPLGTPSTTVMNNIRGVSTHADSDTELFVSAMGRWF